MDRNYWWVEGSNLFYYVALRKESVDRNKYVVQCRKVMGVALRKESVDRNMREDVSYNIQRESLSARRAWIEIFVLIICIFCSMVALRKESVDRNRDVFFCHEIQACRSPQGERG